MHQIIKDGNYGESQYGAPLPLAVCLPLLGRARDLHPLDYAHVGRTKAEGHLSRLASRMEWFPVKYHLLDKVALVVFTVLGYYTGKHHLDDDLVFLWLLAGMPVLIMSVIWGINEVWAWMERRKKKSNSRQ